MAKSIVISGIPGAGNSTVSKLLSKRLGVNNFSAGKLFKDIGTGEYEKQFYFDIFKKLCDEKGIKIPKMNHKHESDAVAAFWKTDVGKSKEFHIVLDELSNILAEKDIVMDGKLAVRMVKKAGLKIWLKASIDERAKRTSIRDGITFEEAKDKVTKRQETERIEWKRIYGFDYWDQENEADLVIDTTDKTPDEIADIIIARIR